MHNHTDSTLEGAPLTTHEHVHFPNGDHVIVHTSPGGVQVTGMLGGEYVEYAGTARDAQEQARLLEADAPDALWTLPTGQARRIAAAMSGAVEIATADVDHTDGMVELTVRLGGRAAFGITLTSDEAQRIGAVLTGAGAR